MILENEYIKKVNLEHRKEYAQFFTPETISDFMASWLLDGLDGKIEILEPAYGLGVFSRSLLKINSEISVDGYDIDKTVFEYAQSNLKERGGNIHLINDNYLTSAWSKRYDGIICNPPYLKFHDYDNTTLIPIVNQTMNVRLNGFTNIYSLFLLKSIYQLKEGGRMAYIVPSEFLNSDYGVEVKRTLLETGVLQHIIIVDFNECAFDDALTTACILLCQKTNCAHDIRFSSINSIDQLPASLSNYSSFSANDLNPNIKWKQYYEDTQSSKYSHLVAFSTFAKVSRGIATGANDYFTFKTSKIDSYNIPEECFLPCICHSTDVKNQIFTLEDFEQIASQDKNVYLFNGCLNEEERHVKEYIKLGVEREIDKKYLTASRKPWYAIENRKPSPIWVSVFNRNGLRFIRNKAGVYNLTTFHCVYNNGCVDTDILFGYLVTDMAKEIFLDNSRQYGNGLTKFEPNDLNKGNVVDLRLLSQDENQFVRNASQNLHYYGGISERTIKLLDDFFRSKYTGQNVELTSYVDKLDSICDNKLTEEVKRAKQIRVKQLNLMDLFAQYGEEPITENCMVNDAGDIDYCNWSSRKLVVDESKNVLISYVKSDNLEQYLDQSAKVYYTGKKFPVTVALNKLYYFMPYLKGKGIKDLYFIKIARVGTRKEGQPDNDPNDFRLVFEIEFLGELFSDYKPIDLEIWRTFTDINMTELFYRIKK